MDKNLLNKLSRIFCLYEEGCWHKVSINFRVTQHPPYENLNLLINIYRRNFESKPKSQFKSPEVIWSH